MGFSITLSEMIILIASVILASAISSCTMYMGNLVISDVSQNVNEMRRATYIKLKIAYATIENDHFVIYVKNVGSLPISDYSSLDHLRLLIPRRIRWRVRQSPALHL